MDREPNGGGTCQFLIKCSGKPPQTVTLQQDLRRGRESQRVREHRVNRHILGTM